MRVEVENEIIVIPDELVKYSNLLKQLCKTDIVHKINATVEGIQFYIEYAKMHTKERPPATNLELFAEYKSLFGEEFGRLIDRYINKPDPDVKIETDYNNDDKTDYINKIKNLVPLINTAYAIDASILLDHLCIVYCVEMRTKGVYANTSIGAEVLKRMNQIQDADDIIEDNHDDTQHKISEVIDGLIT